MFTANGSTIAMRYFGIKSPKSDPIWWITDSEHNSWMSFFTYPNDLKERILHRLPLEEAIRAYKSIGYKCVELNITEKENA